MAFDFPQDLLGADTFVMAVVPGGDEQLVVKYGSKLRVLDRNMGTVVTTTFDPHSHNFNADVTANEQFLYVSSSTSGVASLTHDGTGVASYEDPDKSLYHTVLGPGGLLFCVLFDEEDPEQDEIVALDAQTLQPRYRFGLSMLKYACGVVVVGEELFVCDRDNDRLQVFSLAGEHRRSITGEWKRPASLCLVKDRLCLIEQNDYDDDDDDGELITPLLGRRIFVLSLQGDTLQVYTSPEGLVFDTLCYFDGKLLASVRDDQMGGVEVMALRGV